MQNVFLFTGDNLYAIREERRKWVKHFVAKHNMENLQCVEGEDLVFRTFLDEVSVAPFIADKRLVIMDGVPPWTGAEVERLLSHIHPQVVLLVIAPKIDRRGGAARVLLKAAQCQTFSAIRGSKLHAWIDELARSCGVAMSRDARDLLLDRIGLDQEMLFQEVQKLILYCTGREITVRDVDDVIVPSREWVIWHLTDVMARGELKEAIGYAHKLLVGGHDPFKLWNILLNMLRQLAIIAAAVAEGCVRARDIAAAHKIHPLAVQSLLPLAQRIDLREMQRIIDRVVEMDHALKTGMLRATAEDATELHALIDQCVLAVAGVGEND